MFCGVIWAACVAATFTGCSQSGSETDRVGTPFMRHLDADRAAAEREADTPVTRLFVNGDAMEVEDILRPIRQELAEAAQTLSPNGYQQLLRQRILDEFRRQVRSLLLYQEAAKRLSERENEFLEGFVDDEVRKRVNTEFGGRQSRYEKALAQRGLTAAEDREGIRRELVVMRHLHQTVTQRVLDPTRAELVRFFEERRDDLARPERRKMSLIEIPRAAGLSPRGASHASDATDARDTIAQAKAELDSGADFTAVATMYSKGIHADEGGAWDWVTRGSVREHWEPAVELLFQMEEGEVSPIVETDEAFFIVRCAALEPGVEPDFEALQPKLVQVYRDVQFDRLVGERVHELQEKAVFIPENVGRFLQAVANAAPQAERPE